MTLTHAGHEILHQLLLRIVLCADLSECPQHGVGTEDEDRLDGYRSAASHNKRRR
jgi:hypothetical protein